MPSFKKDAQKQCHQKELIAIEYEPILPSKTVKY